MKVVGVEGYNIRKIGKDKYAVSVNNGNIGACQMNRAQLDEFVAQHGGKIKETPLAAKIGLGLLAAGAVAAAVVLSKKNDAAISAFKNINTDGLKDFAIKAKEFAVKTFKSAKDGVINVAKKVWQFVSEKGKVVIDWVAEKGKTAFDAVKNVFKK